MGRQLRLTAGARTPPAKASNKSGGQIRGSGEHIGPPKKMARALEKVLTKYDPVFEPLAKRIQNGDKAEEITKCWGAEEKDEPRPDAGKLKDVMRFAIVVPNKEVLTFCINMMAATMDKPYKGQKGNFLTFESNVLGKGDWLVSEWITRIKNGFAERDWMVGCTDIKFNIALPVKSEGGTVKTLLCELQFLPTEVFKWNQTMHESYKTSRLFMGMEELLKEGYVELNGDIRSDIKAGMSDCESVQDQV